MWHALRGTDYSLDIDIHKIIKLEQMFKDAMKDYFVPPEATCVEPLIPFFPMPGGALTANTQMMRDSKCLHRYPEVIKAMREVVERGGFGTSVTPVSQFYFQQAFANVMQGPWTKITDGYGKMVLGYFGKTPSQPDPEIVRLAAEQLKLPPTTESVVDINRRTKKDKAGFAKMVAEAGIEATDENIFITAMCGDKGLAYLKGDRPLGIRYIQSEPKKEEKKAAPAPGPCTVVVNGHAYHIDISGSTVMVNGRPYQVEVTQAGAVPSAAGSPAPMAQAAVPAMSIDSPMPGTVVRVEAQVGQMVKPGDVIVVLEAMKMEIPVKAIGAGMISAVLVRKGDVVETGQPLAGIGGTPAASAAPAAPIHVQAVAAAPVPVPAPAAGSVRVDSPMPGTVVRVEAQAGQAVKDGDVIVVLEAMKMEIPVKSVGAGTIKAIHVRKGDVVETGQMLAELR